MTASRCSGESFLNRPSVYGARCVTEKTTEPTIDHAGCHFRFSSSVAPAGVAESAGLSAPLLGAAKKVGQPFHELRLREGGVIGFNFMPLGLK